MKRILLLVLLLWSLRSLSQPTNQNATEIDSFIAQLLWTNSTLVVYAKPVGERGPATFHGGQSRERRTFLVEKVWRGVAPKENRVEVEIVVEAGCPYPVNEGQFHFMFLTPQGGHYRATSPHYGITKAVGVGNQLEELQRAAAAKNQKPSLRVLLITGGCCHNYAFQSQALKDAVAKLAQAEWMVVNEGGTGTQAMIPLYDNPNWAKGYDVVVHNECFADTKSPEYIRKITAAHHAGVPAVVIHCAMHTYRAADIDDWREFLGITSRRHDHQSRYPVKKVEVGHPILKGMPDDWVTPKDELYVVEKLWPNARALATSASEQDGKTYPVVWTNQYGKARVFGTTYGHSDDTFRDPVFLTLTSRGLLWAAGRLEE